MELAASVTAVKAASVTTFRVLQQGKKLRRGRGVVSGVDYLVGGGCLPFTSISVLRGRRTRPRIPVAESVIPEDARLSPKNNIGMNKGRGIRKN